MRKNLSFMKFLSLKFLSPLPNPPRQGEGTPKSMENFHPFTFIFPSPSVGRAREGGRNFCYLLYMIFFLSIPTLSHAGSFAIDAGASTVMFKMPYADGYTMGMFGSFKGKVELSAANDNVSAVDGELDLRSVNTLNWQRDQDLQGADFFNTLEFPIAMFKSKSVDGKKVKGDLTLKGKTKEVTLACEIHPVTANPDGKPFALVTLSGEIKLKDFGIVSDRKLERGQAFMGDTVAIKAYLGGVLH